VSAADDYIAARAAFVEADHVIDQIARTAKKVGESLELYRSAFSFSNTGVALPAEVVMDPRSPPMDGRQWPNAEAIMESLARWHSARQAVMSAWDSFDNSQKNALQPPPQDAAGRL
jgi:hypothetical protein